jgi:hypothetical protein
MRSTVEAGGADPDNARRSGPVAVTSPRRSAYLRARDGLAVVLAGAAAGYGGDRRRPVTGAAVRGSRRAVGLASEGRGESCRPATARPPGEPRPPTAGHPGRSSPLLLAYAPRCSRPGRQARRAEGAPLMIVKIILTAQVGRLLSADYVRLCPTTRVAVMSHHAPGLSDNWIVESPCHGCSGQSNLAQMVRVVRSPSMPHSSARARTMSSPWCRVGSIIPWFQGPPSSWTSILA